MPVSVSEKSARVRHFARRLEDVKVHHCCLPSEFSCERVSERETETPRLMPPASRHARSHTRPLHCADLKSNYRRCAGVFRDTALHNERTSATHTHTRAHDASGCRLYYLLRVFREFRV